MPSTRKSLKTLIRFANELLRQSVIGLDATLKSRLVTDVSNKLDTAPLTGNGTSGSITGLINQAGVQTGALDVADADSLLGAVALASAAEVLLRWKLTRSNAGTSLPRGRRLGGAAPRSARHGRRRGRAPADRHPVPAGRTGPPRPGGAAVVVLDEATPEAESTGSRILERAARAVTDGRTTLVVAHRLTQAATADRIVVIDTGRVVQCGTHDEFSRGDGLYASCGQPGPWHTGRA
jgi:hypothetical protein